MPRPLRELDDLLRGRKTTPAMLAEGTDQLRIGQFVFMSVILGMIYGVSMGLYSVLGREEPVPMQLLASTLKVPLLFLLTLAVTFPSLYVFSALLGSRMGPLDALRVIVASVAVNLAVLASLAPITAFFTLSTTSYNFMKLLSVFLFSVSGMIGLGFLLRTLRHIGVGPAPLPPGGEASPEPDNAGPELAPHLAAPAREVLPARRLFRVWIIVYALVGAQMSWVLRPFIGAPDLEFTWFGQRGGNVFLNVLEAIGELLGG